MKSAAFTQLQLDALKEIGNISAGNAATAFSQMVGRKIRMTVPQVDITDLPGLQSRFEDGEVKIGLYQKILGEGTGSILMVFPRSSTFELIGLILPERIAKPKILRAADEDLLKELSNIVAGAYLTTLTKLTNMFFMPTVPHLTIDLAKLMVEHFLQAKTSGQFALVVLNQLEVENSTIQFQLILLPHPEVLPHILKSIGTTG